ncbi:hypothetical protein [Microbispora bryophytorum]|uniref:hypothetical protein n=1 Tax=Microbispora bryophytorum TaxID=1460882 RepID=UPI0033C4FA2A
MLVSWPAKSIWVGVLAVAALAAYLVGVNEPLVLASGAILVADAVHLPRRSASGCQPARTARHALTLVRI